MLSTVRSTSFPVSDVRLFAILTRNIPEITHVAICGSSNLSASWMSNQRASLLPAAPGATGCRDAGHSPHAIEQVNGISDEPVRPSA